MLMVHPKERVKEHLLCFSTFMTYKRYYNDLWSCLTILKCQIMTYMHLDVFPADRLGWLCRALNTRDAGHDSLVQISGIYLRRTIRIFHVW